MINPSGLCAACLLALATISGCVLAREPSAPIPGNAAVTLAFKEGRVSGRIRGVPLREVLSELSRQTGIPAYLSGGGMDEKIRVQFEDLPLEEALRRILGRNYILVYARANPRLGRAAPGRLSGIRVLSRPAASLAHEARARPPGAAAPIASPRASSDTSPQALSRQALQAARPADRIAALRALAALRKPDETLSTFTAALRDADAGVRQTALSQVRRQGMAVSLETLSAMAIEDPKPELRLRAWNEIVDRAEPQVAQEYLVKGLKDPDPKVRGIIERMLSAFADAEAARAPTDQAASAAP